MPAMAPPESDESEDPLSALFVVAAEGSGVVEAETDATGADVDDGVVDDDDDEVVAVNEARDFDLAMISLSSMMSKAAKAALAFFRHIGHEYPPLERHSVSRYIEMQRLEPSGSQVNSLSFPMVALVQPWESSPRWISVASVALVVRNVHAFARGIRKRAYSGSIVVAAWIS